jgi:hypothetical protein
MTSVRVIEHIGEDDGKTYPTVTPSGIKELTPSEREKLLSGTPLVNLFKCNVKN